MHRAPLTSVDLNKECPKFRAPVDVVMTSPEGQLMAITRMSSKTHTVMVSFKRTSKYEQTSL